MPFFSVIIPVFNRAHLVLRAIDSVLSQEFNDYEIIVVDDGSTDGTKETLTRYQKNVRIIEQEHRGVSAARNAGIVNSNSEWILFLDSDDVFLPRKLRSHYDYIMKYPSQMIHQTDEMWIRNGKRVNPMQKHKKRAGNIFIPSLRLCLISPSCACVHRSVFDVYGMFDENLPACEDYDLWLRVSLKEEIGFLPHILTVKYGGHPDQLSKKYWGMDRFRVYSICKLLVKHGEEMDEEKKVAAISVAKEKCTILLSGSQKRGNYAFAKKLLQLIEWLDSHIDNNTDFSFLLQG